uniref:Ig-like domain-containing protein n=1 Tax=Oncorhynchus mykiss TaxID=8022 RepID=A0A8C7S004_ONCMY
MHSVFSYVMSKQHELNNTFVVNSNTGVVWKADYPKSQVSRRPMYPVHSGTLPHGHTSQTMEASDKPSPGGGRSTESTTYRRTPGGPRVCTQILGDLNKGNCILSIDNVQRDDVLPFCFRTDMPEYNQFSYVSNMVCINVKDFLAIYILEVVSASCSVSHSCPSYPPLLTWNHSGTRSLQSQQLTNGQWEVTSSLTFNPTISDNNQPLVCTAAFRGGKTVNRSKTLDVECKVEQSCELTTMFGRFILPFLRKPNASVQI